MSGRYGRWWWLALVVAILGPAEGAGGQTQVATRGPRFVVAGSGSEGAGGGGRDASNAAVLRRRVSLELNGATIDQALKALTDRAGLEISYSPRLVAVERSVTLRARDITVAAALTEILLDVPVDVSVANGGHLALVQRARVPDLVPVDTGAVVGRVTDAQGGAPIVGATVSVDGTRASATTGADGRYRIGGLAAGTHTVRARYIGYKPVSQSVTVRAGEEATADLVLAKSAQELDQVVVTGTIVPTEVKALPSPVSVIDEDEIARERPHTLQELFRQAIPTAVGWDQAPSPYLTSFSVRGASTLSPGGGQMKVFIDGIEAAAGNRAAVDPNSVSRIEVVRGPQAAALYGSDAIGGVIRIFTKRGSPGVSHPEVNMQSAVGLVQTPYAGFGGVVRQAYSGSVRGGDSQFGYNFGASYTRTGDYLPAGERSAQSSPSIYGGMHASHGIVTVDLSARYYIANAPSVFNPELLQTGFAPFSKPNYLNGQVQNQSIGAQISVTPTRWWQGTLTVGLDRFTDQLQQTQPRYTSPSDSLLQVFNQTQTKKSLGFNSVFQARVGSGLSASLVIGFDHYGLPIDQFSTAGALNTSGTIKTVPGQPIVASHTFSNSTGYFAQTEIGFKDRVFVTAGARAEDNTDFGDSLRLPVSPRVGLSYVQQLSSVTLKLRGSYGQAIRPPSPGRKLASATPTSTTLANPELGPERQKGWDAGIDASVGRLLFLQVTYYDQTAINLIQQVLLEAQPVLMYQWQNVGRVRNTGVELEAAIRLGDVRVRGQYGYSRSRIDQLAPGYAGDLRVGDQSLATPKHTAGASVDAGLWRGTSVSAGVTYVGSWNQYDVAAEFRCFGGTGPCQPTTRDFIIGYPAFAKLNATLSQQLTQQVSAFVAVDNLTNNKAYEFFNFTPVVGRISTVGLRFDY